MKISRSDQNGLIKGILPMLREVKIRIKTITEDKQGFELLAMGVDKSRDGEPIVRGKIYKTHTPVMVPVNHTDKLKKIIKDAKTESQMQNDLALYLAKNGKSLEAIKGEE